MGSQVLSPSSLEVNMCNPGGCEDESRDLPLHMGLKFQVGHGCLCGNKFLSLGSGLVLWSSNKLDSPNSQHKPQFVLNKIMKI